MCGNGFFCVPYPLFLHYASSSSSLRASTDRAEITGETHGGRDTRPRTMASSSSAPPGADSFVLATPEPGAFWPNGERVLECGSDDEGFEHLSTSAASITSSSLAAALIDQEKSQDAFLDAVARLNEERARNDRLQAQVEVARALAGLESRDAGRPARMASRIAAHWRRLAASRMADAMRVARAADEAHYHSDAAGKVGRAVLTFHASLAQTSKTRLKRELIAAREFGTSASVALERKDRQLELHIERQITNHQGLTERLRAMEARALRAEAERNDMEARALEASTRLQEAQAERDQLVNAVSQAVAARVEAQEAQAQAEASLAQQSAALKELQDTASAIMISKEEAETLASQLLAAQLTEVGAATDAPAAAAAASSHSGGGGGIAGPSSSSASAPALPIIHRASERLSGCVSGLAADTHETLSGLASSVASSTRPLITRASHSFS